ncbi:hypothetical protein KFE25_009924 [Diacronema lutheri]|uniref:Uncharacterized protein n=1 Tax=Diacronema lutheri TaxID=2081491 RepID=A0A8J6CAX8_DIALT|nr:hypothetical protein KFE25_009924 [Diacronema lutheri]
MEQLSPELNSLHNRLVASQKEGARVRRSIQQPALRATGVMALGGIAVLVGFLVADLACYAVFGVLLLFPAAFAAILALLPTDQELIRIGTLNGAATNVLLTLAFALLAWQNALVEARADGMCYRRNGSSQPCAVNNAEVAYTAAFAVVSFVQAVRQLRAYAIGLPARAMLDLLWRVGGAHSMLFGVYAPNVSYAHASLAFLASRGGAVGTAAGIAALLGGRSPDEVQSTASALLRAVQADLVQREGLRESTPNPQLYKLSTPALAHQVDAFVSHSWADDAELKWVALQAWREAFKADHGRESENVGIK